MIDAHYLHFVALILKHHPVFSEDFSTSMGVIRRCFGSEGTLFVLCITLLSVSGDGLTIQAWPCWFSSVDACVVFGWGCYTFVVGGVSFLTEEVPVGVSRGIYRALRSRSVVAKGDIRGSLSCWIHQGCLVHFGKLL